MAKAVTLVDRFSVRNDALWNGYADQVYIAGGLLHVDTRSFYPALQSKVTYDFTASAVSVHATSHLSAFASSGIMTVNDITDHDVRYELSVEGTNLLLRRVAGNTFDDTSLPYDAAAHAWWRMREAGGNFYWDTSPDGSAWTNRRTATVAPAAAPTSVLLELKSGNYLDQANPGYFEFDDFNAEPLPPASLSTLTEDFSYRDDVKWVGYDATTRYITGGRLRVNASGNYPALNTADSYDATSSSVSVRVFPALSDPASAALLVIDDSAAHALTYQMLVEGANLLQRVNDAGSFSDTLLTYDAANHAYWRIAESAGSIVWSSSPDALTWTTLRTRAWTPGKKPDRVLLALQCGNYAGATAPGYAEFDNVNIAARTALSSGTAQGRADASALSAARRASAAIATGGAGASAIGFGRHRPASTAGAVALVTGAPAATHTLLVQAQAGALGQGSVTSERIVDASALAAGALDSQQVSEREVSASALAALDAAAATATLREVEPKALIALVMAEEDSLVVRYSAGLLLVVASGSGVTLRRALARDLALMARVLSARLDSATVDTQRFEATTSVRAIETEVNV